MCVCAFGTCAWLLRVTCGILVIGCGPGRFLNTHCVACVQEPYSAPSAQLEHTPQGQVMLACDEDHIHLSMHLHKQGPSLNMQKSSLATDVSLINLAALGF